MKIISTIPEGQGWYTVTHLSRIAARLLEADHVEIKEKATGITNTQRILSLAPRRRGSGESVLVIAPTPGHLYAVLSTQYLLGRHEKVFAWVIDSFWEERIPAVARNRGHFDHLFVTDPESIEPWAKATGTSVGWLPIGVDVLDGGSASPDRDVDVRRVGRQPPDWDDDERSFDACSRAGLRFEGRPQYQSEYTRTYELYLAALARSRFVLAFNNLEAPARYTHPTRPYITFRWGEIVGAGGVVAGRTPDCGTSRELLWPGATLDLGTIERDPALPILCEAVRDWDPSMAAFNHWMALQRLDLRWRISAIAESMGISTPTLDAEMARLRSAIETRRPLGA